MSRHSFDPEIAAKVGLNAAVIYQNILWWCEKNAIKARNIHDGNAWTFNSIDNFSKLFDYLSSKQIRTALQKLETSGLLEVGNYNADTRDRTKWYAPAKDTVPFAQMVKPHLPSGASLTFAQKGKPLPDSKPDINNTPIPPEGANLFLENPKEKTDSSFDAFWNAYPKKAGKEAARKAWAKAVKKAKPSEIIEGAKRYALWLSNAAGGEFRPHPKYPQGWLSAGRWADQEIWADQPCVKPESYARQVLRQYGGVQ